MNFKIETKMQGIYSFRAVNSITGETRDLGSFVDESPNLITTSGLNLIGGSSELFYTCCVGTDSSVTSMGMTALGNQIASTGTIQSNTSGTQPSAPYFSWYRRTFRFNQGVAAGNLTEVGVKSSTGVLFSRALIVDSAGNPTVLTILADEYLDVIYEFRLYPDTNDATVVVSLNGTNYTCTLRASSVNSTPPYFDQGITYYDSGSNCIFYSGSIGSITSTPSGSTYSHNLNVVGGYVNDSFERTFNFSAGLNNANFAEGINSLYIVTSKGFFQVGFSPAIPKTSYMTLSLNLTVKWANYVP